MRKSPPQPTPDLINHVSQILGAEGEAWLADLPRLIAALETRWDVEMGKPFAAGEFNFVAAAVRAGVEPVVVKIAPPYPDNEANHEAAYLRHRDGDACVRLIAADAPSRSMLLERALPGDNLAEILIGRAMEMVEPGISVLRRINTPEPASHHRVPTLDRWFAGLERAFETKFSHRHAGQALNSYSSLRGERPATYLHGDFHPGNIVNATREPYLLIDPKGIVGHIGYDISVFLNNLLYIHPVKADLHAAAERFAEAFGLGDAAVREWAYAGYVLGKWWNFADMPDSYVDELDLAAVWLD